MRKIFGWMLLTVVMVVAAAPALAASTSDFYMTLLRRGISEVDAGRYDTAVTPLRLSAFGLIESIEHYETAQTYLTIAFDKLGEQDHAREAAHRLVAAERVERKFSSLALPQATRTAFETVARKVLSAADVNALTAPVKPGTSTTPPPATITAKPAPSTPAPVQKPPVAPATTKPVIPPPAATTTTTTTAPATKPANPPTNPPATKPITPPQTATTTTKPAATNPAPATTKPVVPQPAPQPRVDVPARLAAGDRALLTANLADARRAYKEVLDAPGIDHATYIRVGEGFYRARDFANALTAFQRAGTFRSGEEAYHYYIAVAAYETGDYDRARRELAAALPHIELTDDVQRYRAKIEAAR
jgi:tetratricopeptide (TPR) repeat protein